MRKYLYVLLCLACFVVGAYVWKATNRGLAPVARDVAHPGAPDTSAPNATNATAAPAVGPPLELASPNSVLVEVGSERITQEDIDWEYNLLTAGVFDKDTLTPIPDLGNRYHEELSSLRKVLVSNVVERKLLFAFVQQDRAFAFDNPARYSACLTEWQANLQNPVEAVAGAANKARLKARLCERSVLNQYLKERLFAALSVDEPELLEYYKNHIGEFRRPEEVEIRQMLLASEGEAKKWRATVNARNFESLARQHSIAPEAENGGRLGPFAKGGVPAVFEVAFHMKKGEISEVLKSNYGYHIIMLLEKIPKKDLSLEEARPRITQVLLKKKQEDAYSKWVERALAAINVGSPKATW